MSKRKRPTELGSTGSFAVPRGNALFESAVMTIGFDESVMRRVLMSTAHAIGMYPESITPHELGVLLPEIERRLRQLAPAERIDDAMRALQHLLLGWDATT